MASHKERHIVHVKDVFANHEDKTKNGKEPEYFFFADPTEKTEEKEEEPKIIQGTNSDVFFGNQGVDKNVDVTPSRKKRQAPKPPGMSVMEQVGEWGDGELAGTGDSEPQLSTENPSEGQTTEQEMSKGDFNVNGFMSSYPHGLSESNSSNSSKATRASLDQSSSGIETDDNSTPQGTLVSAPKISKVARDDYISEQEHDIVSESEEFEEDEMTLDFDEEEVPVEQKRMQLYTEYQGEDYSQYIQDDLEPPPTTHKVKRKVKKRKANKAPISPTSTSSTSSSETRRKGFKTKISEVFNIGTTKSRSGSVLSTGSLQNFTYAESRIGKSVSDRDIDKSKSDDSVGRENGKVKRWWSKDMLSARTLDSNRDVLLKAPSTPHLPAAELDLEPGVVYNADSKDLEFHDFESYRKNTMYDTTKSKGKKGRKSGLWKKLTGSLSRGSKSDYESDDNTTVNPLSKVNYGDVSL